MYLSGIHHTNLNNSREVILLQSNAVDFNMYLLSLYSCGLDFEDCNPLAGLTMVRRCWLMMTRAAQ